MRVLRPISCLTRLGKNMWPSTRYKSVRRTWIHHPVSNGGHVWQVGRSSSAVSCWVSSDRTPWYGETKTNAEILACLKAICPRCVFSVIGNTNSQSKDNYLFKIQNQLHVLANILFIFIPWIRTGLQNPYGFGNSQIKLKKSRSEVNIKVYNNFSYWV